MYKISYHTMMTKVSSEQSRSQCSMHTECCCQSAAAAAAAALCVSTLLLLLHQIVCRMAEVVAGSFNLIPVSSFFSSCNHYLFLISPLAVICRIYGIDWPTSSVLTGIRGAKAGASPPRRTPLCTTGIYNPPQMEIDSSQVLKQPEMAECGNCFTKPGPCKMNDPGVFLFTATKTSAV